jgi:AraC-like DNA-binding protein
MICTKYTDIFKKLTLESINQIPNRIRIRKQKELLGESGKSIVDENLIVDEINQVDKRFISGKTLPDRIKKKFPAELTGVPIEEIDEFQIEQYVSYLV